MLAYMLIYDIDGLLTLTFIKAVNPEAWVTFIACTSFNIVNIALGALMHQTFYNNGPKSLETF